MEAYGRLIGMKYDPSMYIGLSKDGFLPLETMIDERAEELGDNFTQNPHEQSSQWQKPKLVFALVIFGMCACVVVYFHFAA